MRRDFAIERRKNRQKFYNTRTWQRIRQVQLTRSGLCKICFDARPKRLSVATVCDHVNPGWESWDDFVRGPFQSLCRFCHNEKNHLDMEIMRKKERTKLDLRDV